MASRMMDMYFWDEATIDHDIYYDPGAIINLRRKKNGIINYAEVKVIETYSRFVLVEGEGGVRFTVLKKDLFFKEVVEW